VESRKAFSKNGDDHLSGNSKKSVFGPLTIGFWSRYMITMRPYLLFISGAAGLVGMSLIEDPVPWKMVLGFIPFFLSYGLGQALTDVFQTDTDSISSKYRPMVRKEILKRDVFLVSIGGLLLGVLILGFINPYLFIPGIIAVIGLATYTSFKRRWWGGPPWNSWIVATLVLDGIMIDKHFNPILEVSNFTRPALMMLISMAAVFFAYANFVVTGYFKDISADRATGYETFQVKFGWKAGAIYGDILSVLAAASVIAVGFLDGIGNSITRWIWTIPFLLGLAVNLRAQIGIHRIRDESKTHGPILNVVRAFLFYCYAIILISHPIMIILVLPFHIGFEFIILRRPEKNQI
jgi:4-hydroxybenzoate polyprenyltransferase